MKKLVLSLLAFGVMTTADADVHRSHLFSSESVRAGHPDKMCDQLSDTVLDAFLAQDPQARVACNFFAAKGKILVGGEITSTANVDIPQLVRQTLKRIGYTKPEYGICDSDVEILMSISKQSPDIAQGVAQTADHEQGAGDQGLMFGYATDETPELMPLPLVLSHKITKRLDELGAQGALPWLRPDGKAQVTVRYVGAEPKEITSVIVAAQHEPTIDMAQLRETIKKEVIDPVCGRFLTEKTKYFINATGAFVFGGPAADTGLTGRKIIVDSYGGAGRHGGGAFSGKDPSKVDRSAAYMARHIAKNIVAAGLAHRCEVQIAYSIGVADPVSVYVNTFGTATASEKRIEDAIKTVFPLKPARIIEYLNLKRPIYAKTAAYGHFGRDDQDFTWEQTNKVDALKAALTTIA